MVWIKRNLYFLIGSAVALALLGWAGFYLYQKNNLNNEVKGKLNETYDVLNKLNNAKPHPGDGQKVDNIKAAKAQEAELRAFIEKSRKYFERIPPIPDAPKVTSEDFTALLRRTIDQLQRDAGNASVSLQPRYDFSFQAQKQKVTFAPGSLEPLAVQLGEVKVICDILFRAKINSLDSLKRERVSADDSGLADYLEDRSVTNDLAVLTPYEVTFRCFSPELAAVMGGLASSPHCFIVKTINVEPGAAAVVDPSSPGFMPSYAPAPVPSFLPPPINPYVGEHAPAAPDFARRYGLAPGRPPAPLPAPPVAMAPAAPRGLPTVLNEKQIKVVLLIHVVKLKPSK